MYATFDTNNKNKHGTGIGLYICKKLIEQLGPSNLILVDSSEGKGTNISFFLYINLNLD